MEAVCTFWITLMGVGGLLYQVTFGVLIFLLLEVNGKLEGTIGFYMLICSHTVSVYYGGYRIINSLIAGYSFICCSHLLKVPFA